MKKERGKHGRNAIEILSPKDTWVQEQSLRHNQNPSYFVRLKKLESIDRKAVEAKHKAASL